MPEFHMIHARKFSKNIRMFMIFAWKINKIPEFYTILAPKVSEFYINIARKIFFSEYLGARAPPAPVPPSPRLWSKTYNSLPVQSVNLGQTGDTLAFNPSQN